MIESFEGQDINRFLGLFEYFALPCNSGGPISPGVVICEPRPVPAGVVGTPHIGSPVNVVAHNYCFVNRSTMSTSPGTFFSGYREPASSNVVVWVTGLMFSQPPRGTPILYAVARGAPLALDAGIPSSAVVVFVNGQVVVLGESGVTYLHSQCDGDSGAKVVQEMERHAGRISYILPPP